jgi:ACT domain-containing protein
MKKVITAEQLRAYRGRADVCFEDGTILTPSAQDAAREMGLSVRIGNCEAPMTSRSSAPQQPGVAAPLPPLARPAPDGSGELVIIAAFGQDRHGILAALTAAIAERGGSIRDVSQTILEGYFSLILSVAVDAGANGFSAFKQRVKSVGESLGLEVSVHKHVIFQAMHRI